MEEIGASKSNIMAVIGPCISQNAYEVGIEFYNEFIEKDHIAKQFFKKKQKSNKFYFNLPGYSKDRLMRCPVKSVIWTGHCTYSDKKNFFSYRRSFHKKEGDFGRLISVIAI